MAILIMSPIPGDEIFERGGIIYITKFKIIKKINGRNNLSVWKKILQRKIGKIKGSCEMIK